MPDPIPVAVSARLAVDLAYQGRGLGRALFRDAARRVAHAADAIGIRGIVVHAISEEARKFYIALGFNPCPHAPMTLVVTLFEQASSRRPVRKFPVLDRAAGRHLAPLAEAAPAGHRYTAAGG